VCFLKTGEALPGVQVKITRGIQNMIEKSANAIAAANQHIAESLQGSRNIIVD
jgi:hypothetical protein